MMIVSFRTFSLERSEIFNPSRPQEHCRVVINEIMVDPTPLVGLPDFEWIELLNNSACMVDLAGWQIVVGTVSRVLPQAFLQPGEFIILCSATASQHLLHYGRTLSLSSLPALRNSGNRITLLSNEGKPIDIVDYSDTWYRNSVKRNGGWTLERIDPERSCGQEANWTASLDPRGGTPGAVNSVFAHNPDLLAPTVIRAAATSLSTAVVIFSEPMDSLSIKTSENFNLSDGIAHPASVRVINDMEVVLSWNQSMWINKTYTLTLNNIRDACGNPLDGATFRIEWVKLEPGDVVVNEVLFNPYAGGADFVEIFNRSEKRIDTGKLTLAGRDNNLALRQQVSLRGLNRVLEPGGYLAVTIDTSAILTFYHSDCRSCIVKLPSMPAYNNDKGYVVLLGDSMQIIDEMHYTEKMHHPLLHTVKGVSLERVNPFSTSALAENWQSASSAYGFATPGYQNSQHQDEPVRLTNLWTEPYAISPNLDGYNDELIIRYETRMPGWVGNGWVFDASGRLVHRLMKNELLGTSGQLTWNGADETGSRLPVGPYILMIELFDMKGSIERFKKPVVITERWE